MDGFSFSAIWVYSTQISRLRSRSSHPKRQLALSGSLIGAPPLLVLLGILGGEGHLTFTYNPRVLNTTQIEQIAQAFSAEWLEQHQNTVKYDAMVS